MNNSKLVKEVSTKRWSVCLYEETSGGYVVETVDKAYNESDITQALDWKTASNLFDSAIQTLEGN